MRGLGAAGYTSWFFGVRRLGTPFAVALHRQTRPQCGAQAPHRKRRRAAALKNTLPRRRVDFHERRDDGSVHAGQVPGPNVQPVLAGSESPEGPVARKNVPRPAIHTGEVALEIRCGTSDVNLEFRRSGLPCLQIRYARRPLDFLPVAQPSGRVAGRPHAPPGHPTGYSSPSARRLVRPGPAPGGVDLECGGSTPLSLTSYGPNARRLGATPNRGIAVPVLQSGSVAAPRLRHQSGVEPPHSKFSYGEAPLNRAAASPGLHGAISGNRARSAARSSRIQSATLRRNDSTYFSVDRTCARSWASPP